jgi:hypothetical protein
VSFGHSIAPYLVGLKILPTLLPTLTFLLFTSALFAQSTEEPFDRKKWLVQENFGVPSLAGRAFSSGWATWRDQPVEYNTNWSGYGQRFGMRMVNTGTRSLIEAGVGAAIGEDPRYRKSSGTFKHRLMSAVKQSVLTQRADGTYYPAYARYAAVSGSSFLSNAWRPDSESTTSDAMTRIGYGFLSRVASNAVVEFGAEIKRLIRRK